jgi:hypothetical protein
VYLHRRRRPSISLDEAIARAAEETGKSHSIVRRAHEWLSKLNRSADLKENG